MAYYDTHLLANDQDFVNRSVACAAVEGIPDEFQWAVGERYPIAAAPGFGDAYESALIAGVEHPGRDQAVISDAQLLAQVQVVAGIDPTPPTAVSSRTQAEAYLIRRGADPGTLAALGAEDLLALAAEQPGGGG